MADLDLSVTLTRDALGLDPLELNDYLNYYIGDEFLGGSVAWNRTKIGSPWDDGEYTTQRSLQNVTEPVSIEVLGGDISEVQANQVQLTQAFFQDTFDVTVTVTGVVYAQYHCEAADLTSTLTGPRLIEGQVLMKFNVPRQPIPVAGIY